MELKANGLPVGTVKNFQVSREISFSAPFTGSVDYNVLEGMFKRAERDSRSAYKLSKTLGPTTLNGQKPVV